MDADSIAQEGRAPQIPPCRHHYRTGQHRPLGLLVRGGVGLALPARRGQNPTRQMAWGEPARCATRRALGDLWAGWITCNLMIATGQRSTLVVLDIAPRHGGSLDAVAQHAFPQDTVAALTGGKQPGWHFYYAYLDDGQPLLRLTHTMLAEYFNDHGGEAACVACQLRRSKSSCRSGWRRSTREPTC